MTARETYNQWLAYNGLSAEAREELLSVGGDEKEIEDRFFTELSFGTAGMRGVLGIGSNRMNAYNVRKATQGLAEYILDEAGAKERGVAVAYDSRRMSAEFALETALVLCGNGIRAFLFESIRAVPQISFAIPHLGCIGGVMITASHNPKEYNGYKVYWENGAQIGPVQAEAVTKRIFSRSGLGGEKRMEKDAALNAGLLRMIGAEVDEAYFAATESLALNKTAAAEAGCSIVYTPLHGAGSIPVQRLLKDIGIKKLFVVPEQQYPDPDFSTVSAPNPEAPDAFKLAIKLANEKGADVILATDPDSDRLGVAVRDEHGEFTVLTGNQIGALMLEYLLSTLKARGALPENALVVRSIVSSRLADTICAAYGVEIEEVLTGFRYIGEKIAENERTGEKKVLFGFEESYGFLLGTFARDKDAIGAAMLLAEAASYYALEGLTLYKQLRRVFQKYGYFAERVKNYTLYGKEGMEKIQAAMAFLRSTPPKALGGIAIAAVRDYKASVRTEKAGNTAPIALPKSDVLYYEFEDGGWACARPSGTEPKLKLYTSSSAENADAVNTKLEGIIGDMEALLTGILGI